MSYIRIFLIAIDALIFSSLTIICLPVNFKGKATHLITKIFSKIILLIAGAKLEVTGKDNLDKSEKYIFISNHLSYLDIPVLMQVVPNNVRFIYKKVISWVPIFGWAMYLNNYIPINRTNAREALQSLKKAASRMKKGYSIAIFPEGTRSVDGKTGEFKKGIFVLAIEAQEKIVPVTIIGTNNILPKKSFKFKAGRVKVIIDKPLEFRNDKNFLSDIREKIIENKLNNESELTAKFT
jgi:1-acyl-sn-glycerol-3-phosphate acyltransferase